LIFIDGISLAPTVATRWWYRILEDFILPTIPNKKSPAQEHCTGDFEFFLNC